MKIVEDAVYLCSCVLNGETPEKEKIQGMDLNAVYSFAARHMLAAIVATAVETAGFKDEKSSVIIARALKATLVYDVRRKEVFDALERSGIWYMPVKGSVLKDLYPKYGIREMSDNDILFDAEHREEVRDIMEGLGYETEVYGKTNQDVYTKPPFVTIEMHTSLFKKSNGALYDNYFDVKTRLVKEEGNDYGYRFTPEDMYVYVVAHEFKHFSNCGTGLRSLADTYVCLKKLDPDFSVVESETDKLGISDFEKANRSLATHLFGGEKLTDGDKEMLDYISASGTYGTTDHLIENRLKKKGNRRLRYITGRFSVPFSRKNELYDAFAEMYPAYYRHKVLLPFLPFHRLIRSAKDGRLRSEARVLKRIKK